jgi:hypothetical protein
MTVLPAGASPWPARLAYCAAGIFISASGGTNLAYGWAKGSDVVTSTIWAGVAGGVSAPHRMISGSGSSFGYTSSDHVADRPSPIPCISAKHHSVYAN